MSILLFVLGLAFGLFWFTVIPIPLLYGLPRAALWVLRGAVRSRAVLGYLITVLFWFLLLTGFAVIWPGAARYLADSAAFSYGSLLGVGVAGGSVQPQARPALTSMP